MTIQEPIIAPLFCAALTAQFEQSEAMADDVLRATSLALCKLRRGDIEVEDATHFEFIEEHLTDIARSCVAVRDECTEVAA